MRSVCKRWVDRVRKDSYSLAPVKEAILMLLQRWTVGILAVGLLWACSATPSGDMTSEMIGRWDVTVREEGDVYPLWFEIVAEAGGLGGRLQPRGGHARAFERIEITGNQLSIAAVDTTLTGSFVDGRLQGVGHRGMTPLEWTAIAAPRLEKPAETRWGESISLFNGKDLSGWRPASDSRPNLWSVVGGAMVNGGRGTHLMTEQTFWNFKLNLEVNCPEKSNSGIYLRGRYEVQVEDNHGMEPGNRRMGGIYGQITPTSNPARPAGEWQTVEVTLLGRWVTVDLNGERIIDDVEIPGCTGGALDCNESEPGPLLIQGDHGAVSYRNIVLTPALP